MKDDDAVLNIKTDAWTSTGVLLFPDDQPVSYFEQLKLRYDKVRAAERYSYASTARVNQGARHGDSLALEMFADQMKLNTNSAILKTLAEDVAVMTLSNKVHENRGGGTLVCGSPNEVAPDPSLDDYFDVIHRDLDCIGCQNSYGAYDKQKATVWAMNALEAEDQARLTSVRYAPHRLISCILAKAFLSSLSSFQLCQRMAWSLYQLLNVGAASNPDNTESNLYTYDILTRHCFGSYFDILKEMAYSPKMGEQFNFVDSSSTRCVPRGYVACQRDMYGRVMCYLFELSDLT